MLFINYVKNNRDLFVYDVMAAILNNLHIVKNAQGFTSGTQRIWNQHLHFDQKPSKKQSILAITTHRMPYILKTFRNTKRHWNYLKLYSNYLENAADSADVFTFSNINSHPKFFPFKPRRVFYPRFRKLYIDIEYPFSTDKARKLGCIEHRVVTCNFSKSIDNALKFGGKIYFLDFTLFINSGFIVFPHDLIGGSKQCSLNTRTAQSAVRI